MKKLDFEHADPSVTGNAEKGKDPLIAHVFDCIGTTNKYYVEIGAGDGILGTATYRLREVCGWTGLLLDRGYGNNPAINKWEATIYRDNIVSLLQQYNVPMEFDYYNMDIDGNDFWVLMEILKAGYRPRLIVAESNVRFDTYENLARKYEHDWPANSTAKWWGASPYAYKLLGEKYGYVAVHINYDDIFLVRKDCLHPDDLNPNWELIHPQKNLGLYASHGPSVFEPDMWETPQL